ncbi:pilus assembly protein PilW [Vibrio metschnikovii]
MAFQRAKYRQSGASLVEFMIASLVGSIALAIIGSVFLSNQRVALQRSQHIMLQQQMSMVMHQLKRDVLRAGYNGINNHSVIFSDQDDLLAVTETSIGYVYYTPHSSSGKFSHTLYRLDNGILRYRQINCTQIIDYENFKCPEEEEEEEKNKSASFYSLFEPKQVRVTQFSVKRFPINGQAVQSAVISIDVSASLVANPAVAHSMQLHITQRNWQS